MSLGLKCPYCGGFYASVGDSWKACCDDMTVLIASIVSIPVVVSGDLMQQWIMDNYPAKPDYGVIEDGRYFRIDGKFYGPIKDGEFPEQYQKRLCDKSARLPWEKGKV